MNLQRMLFTELEGFLKSKDTMNAVSKFRGSKWGSVLFRLIGLDVIINMLCQNKQPPYAHASSDVCSRISTKLTTPTFAILVLDTGTNPIVDSYRVILREVLLYMLKVSRFSDESLLERYRKDSGDVNSTLPDIVT